MLSLSAYIDRGRKSAIDAARDKVAQDARAIFEPCLHVYKCEIIDLRHEVARLKVYEEFVLGRGRQYGALRRLKLRSKNV